MTRTWFFLILSASLLLPGCQSGFSLGGGLFARKESTSLKTPRMRMEEAAKLAKTANGQDTPDQQQAVLELAEKIQTEPDPLVRDAIVKAIARFKTPLASQVLAAGLQDTDPLVRRRCCQAIGQTGDGSQAGTLANVVRNDDNLDVRIEAVRALGTLPAAEAKTALVAALQSDDPALQYTGLQSMKQATGREFGGDVRACLAYAQGDASAVAQEPVEVASRTRRFWPF